MHVNQSCEIQIRNNKDKTFLVAEMALGMKCESILDLHLYHCFSDNRHMTALILLLRLEVLRKCISGRPQDVPRPRRQEMEELELKGAPYYLCPGFFYVKS